MNLYHAPDYNLQEILAIDIRTEIPAQLVSKVTSQPPFVSIPGLLNLRDISNGTLRPRYVYPSGALAMISDEGKASFRDLGITTIF
jgi:hypothetical protein